MQSIKKVMYSADVDITKDGKIKVTGDSLTDITVPGKQHLDMIIDDVLPKDIGAVADTKRYKLTAIFFTILVILASHSVHADSKGGVLEIEALKFYMSSRSHAAIDIRFINSSPDEIQHWSIDIEVYDKNKKYLGRGGAGVSHIQSGASKVEQAIILDTNVSDIGSWKATLAGVVGYSGMREDQKYNLKIRK